MQPLNVYCHLALLIPDVLVRQAAIPCLCHAAQCLQQGSLGLAASGLDALEPQRMLRPCCGAGRKVRLCQRSSIRLESADCGGQHSMHVANLQRLVGAEGICAGASVLGSGWMERVGSRIPNCMCLHCTWTICCHLPCHTDPLRAALTHP